MTKSADGQHADEIVKEHRGNRDRLFTMATEANMKATNSAGRSAAGSKTNRRGLLKTAALGGGALLGTNLLSAINNGAKAAGEPIPVGGGAPDRIRRRRRHRVQERPDAGLRGDQRGRRHPRPAARAVFRRHQGTGAATIVQAVQRLIDRYNVHAILNGYNIGPAAPNQDVIADAGIIYIHYDTDVDAQRKIKSNRENYFGIFRAIRPNTGTARACSASSRA